MPGPNTAAGGIPVIAGVRTQKMALEHEITGKPIQSLGTRKGC